MARDAYEQLNLPAGQGGINRSKALPLVPIESLSYADTITVERDLLEKEPGAILINTVALATGAGTWAVTGLWEFVAQGSTTVELVAYIDNGSSASLVTVGAGGVVKTLMTGLTPGGFPMADSGWDGATKALFIVDGKNEPMVYLGGAAVTAVKISSYNGGAGKPGDWSAGNWPTGVTAQRARIVMWGNNNFSHSLYMSVPGVHWDFVSDQSSLQRVYPGEGDGIAACLSWRDTLYIGKHPLGIYVLDDTDPNIANWAVNKLTDGVGLGGPGGMIALEDDVAILGDDGFFYALSQVQTLGQKTIPPFLPIETANFVREQINVGLIGQARAVWYGRKRQLHISLPALNATVNNRRMVMDLHRPAQPHFLWSTRDICPAIALWRSTYNTFKAPIIGDAQGFCWLLDQTARDKGGAGYNGQYEYPSRPLYPAGRFRANLEELEVTFQPQGNWNLTMEVDRDTAVSQTLQFSMQTPGAPVGSASLDADVLSGLTIANQRHRLTGDCRYVKLIGYNNQADQNFAVVNHAIRYTKGSDRP